MNLYSIANKNDDDDDELEIYFGSELFSLNEHYCVKELDWVLITES